MFTDRQIQALKPKDKMYDVREGKGFTVRVLPSGTKTFYYVFKLEGKRFFYYIGPYGKTGLSLSDARIKYHAAAQLVNKGINPIEANKPVLSTEEIYTVARLIKDYLSHLEKTAATSYVATARLTLNNDVLPALGKMIVSGIRRRDAVELVEKVAARAPAQGQGVLKFSRAMFTYALHRERCEFNPFADVSAAVPAATSSSRKRVLSDEEIKYVWASLTCEKSIGSEHLRAALLFILITAQRPGEVAGMPTTEINGDWWIIPEERAKNGIEQRVFLSPLAKRMLPETFCPWYFPSPVTTEDQEGNIIYQPIGRPALSHLLSKSPKDQKGNSTRQQYLGLPRWTPHDLRRTAATKLSELGCPDEVIDAILNHVKKGVIGVYNRNRYDAEKKKWLLTWGESLENLVS